MPPKPIFDLPHYERLNETREAFLREFLPAWIGRLGLNTAIDVGCGLGYFSRALQGLGLRVTACDGRRENVEEASRRYPQISFRVANVEDSALESLGKFDLVFCFGLLYHLENPFAALRNLHALTGKVLLVESMCVPGGRALLDLREEGKTEDQGLNFVAFYPTEPCLVKMLHSAGFPFVYRFSRMPEHEAFHEGGTRKQMRTMLAASKDTLEFPILVRATDPPQIVDPWATGWGKVRGSADRLRALLRPDRVRTR
jgi:SAM-dependent methyltransferase